ncbi:FAD-binding oxidoreductase [Streptomyces sp. ISL-94]|uniref:FAD-binding oxidoreductase n=1 Tax=Streptomyces sp. ISL-94 TaxID=2819190 RepID=UPI001BE50A8A|nr:FAD-binding protein [Streptomyces sp. ISL-94]MBT2479789.1 FAD-binding oxidoreductase [Streptomyces sp. ISL-94]
MPETTSGTGLDTVLDAVEKIVGIRHVTRPETGTGPLPPTGNVSGFGARATHAVIRPGTVNEIRAVIQEFDRRPELPGLHAVSTGRNWGLGSKEPAAGPVVRMELDRLDTLRELDLDAGYAIVEPGVTQAVLSGQLAGTTRMLNVTASSGHTSLVGNILDRGVGLRRQRTEDLVGLEAVLPDGRVVRTGWWPGTGAGKAVNPYGLGPSLLHLFTQSPLAVVTAAVIRLIPRPQAQQVVRLTFERDRLAEAVEQIHQWRAGNAVSGVVKIYDTASSATYGGEDGHGYLAHLCVDGTRSTAAALAGALTAEAEACGLFTGITAGQEPAADDIVSKVVQAAYAGSVAHNEDMLASATGTSADRVDAEGNGWLFFLPLIPFTGADTVRALAILDRIHLATGIRPGATVNALDADVIDLVVSFPFDRATQGPAAHQALDLAYTWFAEAGYAPYRIDSEHASWAGRTAADPAAGELTRAIAALIDPNGTIAPGRYL